MKAQLEDLGVLVLNSGEGVLSGMLPPPPPPISALLLDITTLCGLVSQVRFWQRLGTGTERRRKYFLEKCTPCSTMCRVRSPAETRGSGLFPFAGNARRAPRPRRAAVGSRQCPLVEVPGAGGGRAAHGPAGAAAGQRDPARLDPAVHRQVRGSNAGETACHIYIRSHAWPPVLAVMGCANIRLLGVLPPVKATTEESALLSFPGADVCGAAGVEALEGAPGKAAASRREAGATVTGRG